MFIKWNDKKPKPKLKHIKTSKKPNNKQSSSEIPPNPSILKHINETSKTNPTVNVNKNTIKTHLNLKNLLNIRTNYNSPKTIE
jgi:hypothetical protein